MPVHFATATRCVQPPFVVLETDEMASEVNIIAPTKRVPAFPILTRPPVSTVRPLTPESGRAYARARAREARLKLVGIPFVGVP